MHPNDKENIAFITDKGIFCNKVIPFELKNTGAMYQTNGEQNIQESTCKDYEGLR